MRKRRIRKTPVLVCASREEGALIRGMMLDKCAFGYIAVIVEGDAAELRNYLSKNPPDIAVIESEDVSFGQDYSVMHIGGKGKTSLSYYDLVSLNTYLSYLVCLLSLPDKERERGKLLDQIAEPVLPQGISVSRGAERIELNGFGALGLLQSYEWKKDVLDICAQSCIGCKARCKMCRAPSFERGLTADEMLMQLRSVLEYVSFSELFWRKNYRIHLSFTGIGDIVFCDNLNNFRVCNQKLASIKELQGRVSHTVSTIGGEKLADLVDMMEKREVIDTVIQLSIQAPLEKRVKMLPATAGQNFPHMIELAKRAAKITGKKQTGVVILGQDFTNCHQNLESILKQLSPEYFFIKLQRRAGDPRLCLTPEEEKGFLQQAYDLGFTDAYPFAALGPKIFQCGRLRFRR